MDKTKIYCFGCAKLPDILHKIALTGIAVTPVGDVAINPNNVIGYSTKYDEIGYSCDKKWFAQHGYTLVTPDQFEEAWLGKDSPKDNLIIKSNNTSDYLFSIIL